MIIPVIQGYEDIGIPPLRSGDKLYSTDKAKAEALNFHFHSVFTKARMAVAIKDHSPYDSIPHLKISTQVVHKQLSQLNPTKACGPDELPARVLKELAPSTSSCLCYIFQQPISPYNTGTLPLD